MRRLLLTGTVLTVFGAALVAGAAHIFTAPGPLATATSLVVPRGGVGAVAHALAAAGVIRDSREFQVGGRIDLAGRPDPCRRAGISGVRQLEECAGGIAVWPADPTPHYVRRRVNRGAD